MTMTIGMLHYRAHPDKVKKAYTFAAVARMEGLDFFYFTPRRVDLDNKKINGFYFDLGAWHEKIFAYPDVIYNEGSAKTDHSLDVFVALRQEVLFTSHSVGAKTSVYERLLAHGKMDQFVIPYENITSPEQVIHFLYQHQQAIIKPVWGHKGIGIVHVQRLSDHYLVNENLNRMQWNEDQLKDFLSQRIKQEKHILQSYIPSRTSDGRAFDFRIHAQKNGQGQWCIPSIYPRVGYEGSFISNISLGGFTNFLTPFLQHEFGAEAYNLQRSLEHFGLTMAAHMDDIYGESFDELGIDVGLDPQHRLWLYEINWKPGPPPIYYLELDVVRHSIQYAKWLVKQNDQQKKR